MPPTLIHRLATLGAPLCREIRNLMPAFQMTCNLGLRVSAVATAAIAAQTQHVLMSVAKVSNSAAEKSVHRMIRHSFAIAASLCLTFSADDVGFSAEAQQPMSNNAQAGLDSYLANCSACHQTSGEGIPGVFPPLKGSGVVNKEDASKHIQVILYGMKSARAGGVIYAAAMPPFAGALSDDDIVAIVNYERRSWGNQGKTVTATQVAEERHRSK
jgi:mono/diheme cytochrome c family protein